jgi:hypothetical protein
MNDSVFWYRSTSAAPDVRRSIRRTVRDLFMTVFPETDVAGKTMVIHSRRTIPKVTTLGIGPVYHGLFSEFQSVLGGLAYGLAHGATGVRVDFRSPLYVDADRGPNWWLYFFERALMPFGDQCSCGGEVHLDRAIARYGRHGGFSDIVQGATPYFYPMTYGIDRLALHALIDTHVSVRAEICDEVARFRTAHFDRADFIVGVHYRGTDATHRFSGPLTHYRTSPIPYRAYADEVRRVLAAAAPRAYRVFVATDEVEFLEFMIGHFHDCLVASDAPRVPAQHRAIHLDRTLPVSNYQKGRSALIDCLLLAATDYVVKGRSNLSDAALAFNPDIPYSFCPDVAIGERAVV